MTKSYKTKNETLWLYRFQRAGKVYRAQGFLTQTEAKDAEAKARLVFMRTATGYLADIVSEYLDYVERNQHWKTYDQKKSHLKKFLKNTGDIPVDQVTPHICQKFLDGFPNVTSNTHRKTLSACFKWCIDMRLIDIFNPFLIVKQKPRDRFIKYIPPKKDIFTIMMEAKANHRDFIRVIYYSLARRGEIVNLLTRDVDLRRKVLTLHTKKRTGETKARRVRMVDPLVEILAPRCAMGNEYVFINPETGKKYFDMNTVLPRLCKKIKIKPFTFHAIRHYGASYLASIGRPAKEIQQLLGHSELRTTEIYLQDLADVAEVSTQIERDPFAEGQPVNEGVNKSCKILKI